LWLQKCHTGDAKSPRGNRRRRPSNLANLEQPIDEDEGYGVKMECCLLASKTNQEAYMGNDDSRWAASTRSAKIAPRIEACSNDIEPSKDVIAGLVV
jgi:hypothetical protein